MEDVGEIRSFRDLVVWQRAVELTSAIYALTRTFPRDEIFGLTNQLRRASISVASNIAEGSGRGTTRDFLKFLHSARGSGCELETQLVIARRLKLGTPEQLNECDDLLDQISRMLDAMIRSLKADSPRPASR